MSSTRRWWQDAVFYQVYPRSFCDRSGDGVGDLAGLRSRLDHLQWLGVDAVWLSPFYRSPMKDYGYDVSDFCDVDPLFGTLDDLDGLLADLHARGMRLMVDWVPNHTSDQHPWFLDARASRDSDKRSWYVWRDGTPDAPPNDWRAAFAPDAPAWTWDEATGQWYLHLFLPEQPDLNWGDPEVVEAMHATLRFWLDRGVDGFRMDVVHAIGKGDDLPDLGAGAGHPVTALDLPRTHELLRGIRGVLDSYDGDRTSVGEVYLLDPARVATYYGDGDELHLSFNFLPLWSAWDAATWRENVAVAEREIAPHGWPTWNLSNHDVPRHRTRYGGSEERARAAAVLLLTLRGTPFLYAGEELGLLDAEVPAERVVDPGGRDGCRAPVPWDGSPSHGWATADTWLPWPPEADVRHAEAQRADPGSVAGLYRRLLAARRASAALREGEIALLSGFPDGVLAYDRTAGDDRRTVLVNMTSVPQQVAADGVVEVASDGTGEGQPYDGRLAADRAVVLRPARPTRAAARRRG